VTEAACLRKLRVRCGCSEPGGSSVRRQGLEPRTVALRERDGRSPDLRRLVGDRLRPGGLLPVAIRCCSAVAGPLCPQCAPTRPRAAGAPTPHAAHPCVRVAVDERQVIPRPRPPGHQIKARCGTLWWQPVPGRQHPGRRCPSARRKDQAWLGGNPLAPPGFASRRGPSAARSVPCNPARTTRPSHVPMMPLTDGVDVMLADRELDC